MGMQLIERWTSQKHFSRFLMVVCRFSGLLPPNSSALYYPILLLCCLSVHAATEILDLYHNIDDMTSVARNIPVTSLVVGSIFKLTALTLRWQDNLQIANELLQSGNLDVMDKQLQQSNMKTLLYFTSGLMILTFWLLTPLISGKNTFPCGAWYPFSVESPFNYGAMYIFQCATLTTAGMIIMVIDLLYVTLIQQTCVHFRQLSDTLRQANDKYYMPVSFQCKNAFGPKCNYKISGRIVLAQCVDFHNHLFRRITQIESLHWMSMLANFLLQVIVLTFLSYLVIISPEGADTLTVFNQAGFLAVAFFQWFLLCSNGDQLIHAQFEVSRAVYECQWFRSSKDFKDSLRLIALRAQVPKRMTVGRITDLNLITFSDTLSRAFSLLTLLYQIKSKAEN